MSCRMVWSQSAGARRRFSQKAAKPLPDGLREINKLPRTPSWSLAELHKDSNSVKQTDVVLNKEKLLELAELCHLHIDDTQIPSMLRDVESILQCTKTIQVWTADEKIDDLYAKNAFDQGIAPLREDVVTDGNIADDVLKNARERAGYYFKVPKVLQD